MSGMMQKAYMLIEVPLLLPWRRTALEENIAWPKKGSGTPIVRAVTWSRRSSRNSLSSGREHWDALLLSHDRHWFADSPSRR